MPESQMLIRPLVRELKPYVYGEQPKIKGLIKLNTNENPFPPSPKVLAAIKKATDARLRLYPNPTAERLRDKLSKLHRCKPENIIVGNGSDELLALATRCFVEPESTVCRAVPFARLFALSGVGRHPWRAEKSGGIAFGFQSATAREL